MSERGNLQALLNAGIEAVHAGDRPTARKLLQQVIRADPRNEVAWMWMASAVTDPAERRACLERALEINPNNQRAREALRRLQLDTPAREATAAARLPANLPAARPRPTNIYLVLAVLVLVVVVAGVIFTLVNATQAPSPNSNGTPNGSPIPAIGFLPSNTPTIDPTTFTATPIFAVVVTLDQSQSNLPATFTPTFTPLPSSTPFPTPTPIPLDTYSVLYSAVASDQGDPQLYHILADGSGEGAAPGTAGGFRDIAIDPTGRQIAFVRDVLDVAGTEEPNATVDPNATIDPNATPPSGPALRPQLFIAPVDHLGDATQLTRLTGAQLERPSWSPDGNELTFASDADGDLDIYTIPAEGGQPARLTSNTGIDKDPAWSPDGARIAYASDQNSPSVRNFVGTTEIFVVNSDGTGAPTQLTDAGGNSAWPSWSPDGREIVFVSDRSGDSDLYVMTAAGEGQNLITFDDQGAEDRDPTYTTDGRWILFTSNRESENFQLYLIDPDGNSVKRVTHTDADVQSVSPLSSGN